MGSQGLGPSAMLGQAIGQMIGSPQVAGSPTPTEQVAAAAAASAGQAIASQAMQEEMDRLVKMRLEQAFGSVFGKVISATERAAQAAEKQALAQRTDSLVKAVKVDAWKPTSREEELRTWREWYFQFSTWLVANDSGYEEDLRTLDLDSKVDHDLLDEDQVLRSQKLYGVLCSLLKNRPLMLVRGLAKEKAGLEAIRLLKREMEPKERARSLAIVRQLSSWEFKDDKNLHEQLIAYEEAVTSYEAASGSNFPEDLVLATVVNGLREPLRSQVQLRMGASTTYQEIRQWILQYENVNAPWSTSLPSTSSKQYNGQQPMEVDQIKGKGKKGKEKGKRKGKWDKGKGKDKGSQKGWQQQPQRMEQQQQQRRTG